ELTPSGSLRVDPASVAVTAHPAEPEMMDLQGTILDALKASSSIHMLREGIALSSSDGSNILHFAPTPMEKRMAALNNVEFRLVRLFADNSQTLVSTARIT